MRAFLLILLAFFLNPLPVMGGGLEDAEACIEKVTQRSQLRDAIALCNRALASRELKGAQLVPVYYNRGWAHDELGDLDAAVEDYSRAVTIRPDFLEGYVARGYTLMRQNKLDEAIADYTLALNADPDLFEARFNRGLAYERKGDLQKAGEDYTRAHDLRPDDARVKAILKRLLLLDE